jgi:transcriptional regulator with XRE-family HTH domain
MYLKTKFGERLRDPRFERRITQEEFYGELLAPLTPQYGGVLERGLKAPSFELLERLAERLKIPVMELFRFEEPPQPTNRIELPRKRTLRTR